MFTLTIETDNEAFTAGALGDEVARILRKVADRAEEGLSLGVDGGKLMDANGNSVGRWEYQP